MLSLAFLQARCGRQITPLPVRSPSAALPLRSPSAALPLRFYSINSASHSIM
jgi:hypothetical protein